MTRALRASVALTWSVVLAAGALAGAGVVWAKPVPTTTTTAARPVSGALPTPLALPVPGALLSPTSSITRPAGASPTPPVVMVAAVSPPSAVKPPAAPAPLPTGVRAPSGPAGVPPLSTSGVVAVSAPRVSPPPPPVPSAPPTPPSAATSSSDRGPVFVPLPRLHVEEEQRLEVEVRVVGGRARVFAESLPPGALWDERTGRLVFAPDLIQGGRTHQARFRAIEGTATSSLTVTIDVPDTLPLPAPRIVSVGHKSAWTRMVLEQRTNTLTSGGKWAGKSYEARICVPTRATSREKSVPVRVFLHGAEAEMPDGCVADEIRIYPADPDTTYWWGYDGQPYTARRVLQLLGWVLDTFPGADPERAYVVGTSMGGAGALTLGLLHARHWADAEADWAQAVPRRQRPGRLKPLMRLWGEPPRKGDMAGQNPWDLQDVTRILVEERSARDQFLYVRHGKDDPVIHFGAAIMPSKLTDLSLYQALELARVGHYVVWDEAGHGPADPVLGKHWWDRGWSRVADPVTFVRRDLAFPAFTNSSANDEPGDGPRAEAPPYDPTRGYSRKVGTPGDTGWNGSVAGVLNRWLRWDARRIVDEFDRLELPLFVVSGEGAPPPRPGYPTKGDLRPDPAPIRVTVTPRRVQRFRCLPSERVRWRFGAASGVVEADADGVVTIRDLEVKTTPEVLVLERG